jgi:hypothetical protein
LVKWWDDIANYNPNAGVRVGEASNPGPECGGDGAAADDAGQDPSEEWLGYELDKSGDAFWIVTHNISSLYAAAERHTATKAHIYICVAGSDCAKVGTGYN